MISKTIVSAPGKLMLLGEHAVVYNHPCLLTAVDERMRATVETLDVLEFQLEAEDVNIVSYNKPINEVGVGDIPKGAKFVEIAVRNINKRYSLKKGIKITTKSEFSSQFGFGSSSASVASAVKGLSEVLGLNLINKEIFDLSYKTVLDIQGKGSGFDVAAAIYGGTLYFVTGGQSIESLEVDSLPLIVGYSGIKADTVTLMSKVKEAFFNRPNRLDKIYNNIEVLVKKGKEAVVKKDWKRLGDLMNKNQEYLKELGVSIDRLDDMIKAALDKGAYGAKLSGAGGGDCMIALYPVQDKLNIQEAIEKAGGTVINVKTNAEGVRVE